MADLDPVSVDLEAAEQRPRLKAERGFPEDLAAGAARQPCAMCRQHRRRRSLDGRVIGTAGDPVACAARKSASAGPSSASPLVPGNHWPTPRMPRGSVTATPNSRTPAATAHAIAGGLRKARARWTVSTSSSNVPAQNKPHLAGTSPGSGRVPALARIASIPRRRAVRAAPAATCLPKLPLPWVTHSLMPGWLPATWLRNGSAYREAGVSTDTIWPGWAASTSSPEPP